MTGRRRAARWSARCWARDAWATAADVMITTALTAAALLTCTRWFAALVSLWAVLALRQGYLTVRTRRDDRPPAAADRE